MYCVSSTSTFYLVGDQEAVVVEGVSEAVVEGDAQVYVLAHV